MNRYLCLDGGTTNTRLSLWEGGRVTQTVRCAMGAKDQNASGAWKFTVKTAISQLLSQNDLSSKDIQCILGCGMLTSEYGLCPLPHLLAPCGMRELHNGMHRITLGEISPIPFVFVPGVKYDADPAKTDMMRGEESEIYGLPPEALPNALVILPGSHSKWICMDENSNIGSITTYLTGEMLSSLANHTILRDAVDLQWDRYDSAFLQMGCRKVREQGLNAALFRTRILKNECGCTPLQCYSFLLGAVLSQEIYAMEGLSPKKILLGGKSSLRSPMAELLCPLTDAPMEVLPEEITDTATARGMVRIYESQCGI